MTNRNWLLFFAIGFALIGANLWANGRKNPAGAEKVTAQIGEATEAEKKAWQTATFGAGCFWGVEATFRETKGVRETAVGYSGGRTKNPTYEEVCSDATGHAEVVQVKYDPKVVSYDKLLDIFWENHDPTQVNRQGPDIGTQYRSVIFYNSPEQKKLAEKSRQRLEASGKLKGKIATTIEPAKPFYKAEDYHQQYLEKRGLASCHIKSSN